MNDIKDLKQLIENVKNDISKNKKDNENFYYQNNGDLLEIIKNRFLKNNINEEEKIKIIGNNIKIHKKLDKYEKGLNCLFPICIISLINTLASFLFLIIFTYENGFSISAPFIFFMLNILAIILSFRFVEFILNKKNKKIKEEKKKICDVFIKNYKNAVLKIAVSIIKDLELIKNESSAEGIELIKKRLIEQAFLFDNNKTKDFMDDSLEEDILSELFNLTIIDKENINNKLIKKEDLFEDISLENKLDLLLKKII